MELCYDVQVCSLILEQWFELSTIVFKDLLSTDGLDLKMNRIWTPNFLHIWKLRWICADGKEFTSLSKWSSNRFTDRTCMRQNGAYWILGPIIIMSQSNLGFPTTKENASIFYSMKNSLHTKWHVAVMLDNNEILVMCHGWGRRMKWGTLYIMN
jgi:hypothetical protein